MTMGPSKTKKRRCFLSIHGDEHQGREAGCRMAERVLNGDASEMDEFLDEVVVIFIFTNPDGWVVRTPQYVGQDNEFQRENGAERDLNRSYPTEGWIAPDHYSGEPWGANLEDDLPGEIDNDVPDPVVEHVPEALTVTEQLRTYENINTLVDMHGQGLAPTLIYTLMPNSSNLHPFGMLDYGIEFLGHTILMNALGYEQQRFVDSDLNDEWKSPDRDDAP